MKTTKNSNGFTLWELILTVTVVGGMLLAGWMIKGCVDLSDRIEERGAKSVVEEFWNGKGGRDKNVY